MKKVLANVSEVMHFWANARQEEGRCGNVYFRGPYLFSYALQIGCRLTDNLALIHEYNISFSTNRHISRASSAASHLTRYYVLSCPYGNTAETLENWLCGEIRERTEDLIKLKQSVAAPRLRAKTRAEKIANFERGTQLLRDLIRDVCRVIAAKHEAETNRDWVRSDYLAEKLADLESVAELPDDWEALREQARAHERAQKAEHEANLVDRIHLVDRIQRWKNGENVSLYGSPYTYLRYRADGITDAYVETSKGIRFKFDDCRKLFLAFKAGRLLGQKINGWKITTVDTEAKVVKAGCHSIQFEEIERMAALLGFTH